MDGSDCEKSCVSPLNWFAESPSPGRGPIRKPCGVVALFGSDSIRPAGFEIERALNQHRRPVDLEPIDRAIARLEPRFGDAFYA